MFILHKNALNFAALSVLAATSFGQDALQSQNDSTPKDKLVAIVSGNHGAPSEHLEAAIGVRLSHTRGFALIENERRDALIKALLAADSPVNDATKVAEKGRQFGVTALLYVTIESVTTTSHYYPGGKGLFGMRTNPHTDYTTQVKANMRLVDVETATIKSDEISTSRVGDSNETAEQAAIGDVANRYVSRIAGLRPELSAMVDDVDLKTHTIYIGLGSKDRIKLNDEFEIASEAERTLQSGRVIHDRTTICMAQVIKVGDDYCVCSLGTIEHDFLRGTYFRRDDSLTGKVQVKMSAILK
ncbi:MAG: CsgG/HfaB family protein [Fimbriimonas sp.]|nr:CsgG/HfaB family protein [Fimbriimonas sp.]